MDDKRVAEKIELNQVVNQFRQLLNTFRSTIRVSVLEGLIEECYGPQALLNGKRINDLIDFKEWLEAKLVQAKEQEAKKAGR
ncbi:MAG: hypothetical protein WB799_23880 [Candidatus Sulfotelmatobacter sp.]